MTIEVNQNISGTGSTTAAQQRWINSNSLSSYDYYTTTVNGVERVHSLRGVTNNLLNPATGRFGFASIKGNGARFEWDAITQGGSSYSAGGLEGTYVSGITGLFERVDDSTWIGGSGELASTDQQSVWKLTCATTHKAIGSGHRTELSGHSIPLNKTYFIDYSFRLDQTWDYGQQAVQPCGLFQVHQETGYGASQFATSPAIQVAMVGSRLTFLIRAVDSELGSDQGNYVNWGFGDIAKIYTAQCVPAGVRYIDLKMQFHLDHRETWQGGLGYFKAWVDGQLVADYVGPTMWPTPQSGVYVEPIPKFGIYMYALSGVATDDVTLASARGMLSNRILYIRKASILTSSEV